MPLLQIFLHKTYEALHEHFPKEMLPRDYGGEEKSFDELAGAIIFLNIHYLC